MKFVFVFILGAVLLSVTFQNCGKVDLTKSSSLGAVAALPADSNGLEDQGPICVDLTTESVQPKLMWDWKIKLADVPEAEQFANFEQTMSSPAVGDLDGDGKVEIATIMFSVNGGHFATQTPRADGSARPAHSRNGVLRVIDAATGATKFSVAGDAVTGNYAPLGHTSPLIIDLDGDSKKEIVYLHYLREKVVAINSDGTPRWEFPLEDYMWNCATGLSAIEQPGGGTEFLVANRIIMESGGVPSVKSAIPGLPPEDCGPYAVSLDPATPQEAQIIGANGVYNQDGTLRFALPSAAHSVADILKDVPGLEVVSVQSGVISMVNGVTGETLFSTDLNLNSELKCPNRSTVGGGPATIGNFDEDRSTIEIATSTGRYLTVLNDKGELIDQFETQDCSSQKTGITSFDFNGDRKPEIIYGDEEYLRILEVRSGNLTEIFKTPNPSGTLWEYPVVADLNGDKSAEILMVSNNYAAGNARIYGDPGEEEDKVIGMATTGIRAFESNEKSAWMPTAENWHQYWFSFSMLDDLGNVLESTAVDGTIRSFNRNKQLGEFATLCVPQ